MVITQYVGILGMILMASSWIPQTLEIFKTGKSHLNLFFAIIFPISALTLTIYSAMIGDLVFIILNCISFIMSGIGLLFTVKTKYFSKNKK